LLVVAGAVLPGVGGGGQGVNLEIGGDGQFVEEPVEIRPGVDAPPQAAAQQAVEDGGTLPGSHVADEQPVLAAEGAGANGVFDTVVVDGDVAILEIDLQRVPLAEGVEDGPAHGAPGPFAVAHSDEAPVQCGDDTAGALLPQGLQVCGRELTLARLALDAVEDVDGYEQARGDGTACRPFRGFEEFSSHMRPAGGAGDLWRRTVARFAAFEKAGDLTAAVALQDAAKVFRDDTLCDEGFFCFCPRYKGRRRRARRSPTCAPGWNRRRVRGSGSARA
jgi:hypothetical protein